MPDLPRRDHPVNRAEAGAVIMMLAYTYPAVVVTAVDEDWAAELASIDFARGMTAARMMVRAEPTFVAGWRTRITLAALLRFVAATDPTHSTSHPVGMLRVTERPLDGEGPDDERPSGS